MFLHKALQLFHALKACLQLVHEIQVMPRQVVILSHALKVSLSKLVLAHYKLVQFNDMTGISCSHTDSSLGEITKGSLAREQDIKSTNPHEF